MAAGRGRWLAAAEYDTAWVRREQQSVGQAVRSEQGGKGGVVRGQNTGWEPAGALCSVLQPPGGACQGWLAGYAALGASLGASMGTMDVLMTCLLLRPSDLGLRLTDVCSLVYTTSAGRGSGWGAGGAAGG